MKDLLDMQPSLGSLFKSNKYLHRDPQEELIRAAGMCLRVFEAETDLEEKVLKELKAALEEMK